MSRCPRTASELVAAALERFGTVNALVNAAALPDRGTFWIPAPELLDRMFRDQRDAGPSC